MSVQYDSIKAEMREIYAQLGEPEDVAQVLSIVLHSIGVRPTGHGDEDMRLLRDAAASIDAFFEEFGVER